MRTEALVWLVWGLCLVVAGVVSAIAHFLVGRED